MKILVAATTYPDNYGKVTLMYIHTRNLYYQSQGIDVTVLCFDTKNDYMIEGINVISLKSFIDSKTTYDILLLHAANLRNHYRFLRKYGSRFPKFIFFYHGHEVLRCRKVYSEPYEYVSNSVIDTWKKEAYDLLKLWVWRKYLPKVKDKSYFIFVSQWMKDEFLKWTKLDESILEGRSSVTYNSIGEEFEKSVFDPNTEKEFDFVTIRNNIDGSKYSVDVVNRLANNTPGKKFLLVGKGNFFNHFKKADNIVWLNQTMTHKEIIEAMQKTRFALMPTRTDAQGLMMCEMAAFGIPVITSDIPVCHEVFGDFGNVYFIDNNDESFQLDTFTEELCICKKHDRFFKSNTTDKEVNMIRKANLS